MKNSDLYSATESLKALANTKINGVVSCTIALNLKTIGAHLETVEAERKKLVEQYSQKDADGKPSQPVGDDGKPLQNQVIIPKDKLEAFSKEASALGDIEVGEIVKVLPIKAQDLKDVTIEPGLLVPLVGWLITA